MKSVVILAVALGAIAPARAGEEAQTMSPVSKVIEMLSDLEAKVIELGKESQKAYDEFSEFCEDKSWDISCEIKTGKAEVEDLKAKILEATTCIEESEEKIEKLTASIASDEADLKNATEIREKEKADFEAEEKDLMEVIDVLERAISILEKEMGKSGALLQVQLGRAKSVAEALGALVQASMFSTADASRLTALVQSSQQEDEDALSLGAPDPAVYKGHSRGIIDTLEMLLEEAKGQLDTARKTETTATHEYELLKQSLEDEIKYAGEDLAKAKLADEGCGETKAVAEGDLEVTSKDLAADVQELADLHKECMTKATEFEAEVKSRGEELKALAEAKKVIKEATAGAESQTYGFEQVSFLQLSRARLTSGADLANFEAVRLVKELADKHASPELAQLASRMTAAIRLGGTNGEDPFAKVKGLIAEMIERLVAEAEADAAHKAWCDKEMSETNAKKDEKEADLEKLQTKIDGAKARSEQLKDEVATLQKELAELAAMQVEMDKLRAEEKAAFEKNKPEMEQGIEGVKLALKILREYYAKEEKAHEAAEGAGGTIIGLLEVCESDFTKLLVEMIATEETAAQEYEVQTKENEITRTKKEQDVKYKTKEYIELDKAIVELTSEKETVTTELDAIYEYLEKLKDSCIAKVEPYEERKRRREAEIAGLKEALSILESETSLLQRTVTRRLRREAA